MEKEVYRQFFELERDNWWFAGMRSIYHKQILRLGLATSDQLVLDVGCGTGIWTQQLGSLGTTIGLDASKEALDFCQSRALTGLLQASACSLPFCSDSFSVVTAFGVIEHIDEDLDMLAELYRVSRPGGYVFLLTSAYRFLCSYNDDFVQHKRRYLRSELRDKVQGVGFDIEKTSYINTILFPGIAAVRMLQRFKRFCPASAEETTKVFDKKGLQNKALRRVLDIEAFLLRFMSFPFGVGLLCIAKKPD